MLLQRFVAEACADLADSLELFSIGVVACEQEGTVDVGSFAFAVVASDDNKVE